MQYDISECSLDDVIEILLRHCKNKQRFAKDANKIAVGGTNQKDYTNKGLRRSRISGKIFLNAIFKNSAAAGSNFYNCSFDKCQIINANFQECSFIKSSFINCPKEAPIIHSNFNESLFTDDFIIDNNYFKHSVFYNTAFINGQISNTTFYSCTLEGTVFSNILMENVYFEDLNIDYAVFENVKMRNVILPFSQICYTFGLLNYLKNTSDEVFITSVANKNGYISKEEYLDLIPYFTRYYKEIKDFFPLANIYFFMGNKEMAKKTILAGILESVEEIDFRKIKYLCKLIYVYGAFNYHERMEIMDYIHSHISFCEINSSLLYSYMVYKKEIESYLVMNNRPGLVTVEIEIISNVFPEEVEKIGVLLSAIEEMIEFNKSSYGEHQIICRHNSAETFLIMLQEALPNAIATVSILYAVLMSCYTLENKRLDLKIKQKTLNNMQTDAEIRQQQLLGARLDNQLKQMEVNKLQAEQLDEQNKLRKEILSKNIYQNNVEITEIKHIIYGNIPTQIDKDFMQYSYRNSKS